MVREICACCHVFRHGVVKPHEIRLGNHHCITTVAEVSTIFQFLCENIAGVDGTGNVKNADVFVDDCFADFAFSKVDVFHTLVS